MQDSFRREKGEENVRKKKYTVNCTIHSLDFFFVEIKNEEEARYSDYIFTHSAWMCLIIQSDKSLPWTDADSELENRNPLIVVWIQGKTTTYSYLSDLPLKTRTQALSGMGTNEKQKRFHKQMKKAPPFPSIELDQSISLKQLPFNLHTQTPPPKNHTQGVSLGLKWLGTVRKEGWAMKQTFTQKHVWHTFLVFY